MEFSTKLVLLTALCLCLFLHAEGVPAAARAWFAEGARRTDGNGDGHVSVEEITSITFAHDTNGDGRIPLREWMNSWVNLLSYTSPFGSPQGFATLVFRFCDRLEPRGIITAEDVVATWSACDTNGDGTVSNEEFLNTQMQLVEDDMNVVS